ncbi:hypothetical protein WMF31_25800 [Sorangium sp. So ce1036]|uniref:hypothetical protein n=1 Tax=Sorangium sp. So ce1036 TaxID=3133328 RepID=UPI003F055149
MRGCWRTWRFGGLTLALSAPLLLAGCAIASGELDEQGDEAWSDLDPMASEAAPGWDADVGDVGHDVDASARELAEPAPLDLRDAVRPSSDDERARTEIYARSEDGQMPEPLPWRPHGSAQGRDQTPSEGDGAR